MDGFLELGGVWLARVHAFYGSFFILLPSIFFGNALLLAAVAWSTISHTRGRQPWPYVPDALRRWARLVIEIVFGLINPILYLTIIAPLMPLRMPDAPWWLAPLTVAAWVLLAAFWIVRVCGAIFDPHSATVRRSVRTLLILSQVCLLIYVAKDLAMLAGSEWNHSSNLTFVLNVLRLAPLYLIPALLLWDYIHSTSTTLSPTTRRRLGLFLLPSRASRVVVVTILVGAVMTAGLAAHRRSDASVRRLISDHREGILKAAARYDVDPRLVAAIVYVTHRDQLSPYRDSLERLIVTAWARNMRQEIGIGSPDTIEKIGTDENPMLNRSLDISVGLAQIKPRTAQTASVLATGQRPDDLPKPAFFSYRDVEPIGDTWDRSRLTPKPVAAPIPVPAERNTVVGALLEPESNLTTCALILSLYQDQWEAANRDWSIRSRADILATLYQIGFARSRPHGAPQSNLFGTRVRQVSEAPWLTDLLGSNPRPQG